MNRTILPILCLCIGLTLLLYPTLSETYFNWQQNKLIREWQQSFEKIALPESPIIAVAMEDMPAINEHTQDSIEPPPVAEEHKVSTVTLPEHVEAMLRIEKIDLDMPVLRGATEKNLNISLASIPTAGSIGAIGNYAIAGHRSRTHGRHFNRLDELVIGDIIEADNGNYLFQYTVVEKLYVTPDEVWVLEANGTEKEITLVTCHPIHQATHRLIVKGVLKDNTL